MPLLRDLHFMFGSFGRAIRHAGQFYFHDQRFHRGWGIWVSNLDTKMRVFSIEYIEYTILGLGVWTLTLLSIPLVASIGKCG